MARTTDVCKGGVALFHLKNAKKRAEKIEVLETLMKQCANSKKGAKRSGGVKQKRAMSGYNCYMKDCAKKSGSFQTCLTQKGWAKLSDSDKQKFNHMATEGCNI